jgi:hypothetical protein
MAKMLATVVHSSFDQPLHVEEVNKPNPVPSKSWSKSKPPGCATPTFMPLKEIGQSNRNFRSFLDTKAWAL